jgi:hypothetical protein
MNHHHNFTVPNPRADFGATEIYIKIVNGSTLEDI